MATESSTFDDPAENPLSEGGEWTDGPGTWTSVKKNAGQAWQATANGPAAATRRVAAFGDAQYSEATIGSWNALDFADVMSRMVSTTDGDCYMIEADGPAGNWKMYRVDDDLGVLTYVQLGAAFAGAPAAADVARLESNGTVHEFKKNGVSQGTRSDATYAAGQPGLGPFNGVDERSGFTRWEGGDLTTRGMPFEGGTAFDGGRCLVGNIR